MCECVCPDPANGAKHEAVQHNRFTSRIIQRGLEVHAHCTVQVELYRGNKLVLQCFAMTIGSSITIIATLGDQPHCDGSHLLMHKRTRHRPGMRVTEWQTEQVLQCCLLAVLNFSTEPKGRQWVRSWLQCIQSIDALQRTIIIDRQVCEQCKYICAI